MKQPVVFLDVDGIMADLLKSILSAHGIEKSLDALDWPRGEDGYYIHEVLGLSWDDLWSAYTEQHVVDMDKMPEADELFGMVSRIDRSWRLCFLTSPIPNQLNGRYRWLRKHYPSIPIAIVDDKTYCCSGPECLLIDDCDKVVESWRRAGGYAILFPRRWNTRHAEANGYFEERFQEEFDHWRITEGIS